MMPGITLSEGSSICLEGPSSTHLPTRRWCCGEGPRSPCHQRHPLCDDSTSEPHTPRDVLPSTQVILPNKPPWEALGRSKCHVGRRLQRRITPKRVGGQTVPVGFPWDKAKHETTAATNSIIIIDS